MVEEVAAKLILSSSEISLLAGATYRNVTIGNIDGAFWQH